MNIKLKKLASFLKQNNLKEEYRYILKVAMDFAGVENPYKAFKELGGYNFNSNTPSADINKAYREMARKFHPDTNPSAGAEFRRLNSAGEILRDTETRNAYHTHARENIARRGGSSAKAPSASSNAGTTPQQSGSVAGGSAAQGTASTAGKLYGGGADASKQVKFPGLKTPTTVTMQSGRLAKTFGQGWKGNVGAIAIPMATGFVISKLTEPAPVNGLKYNVTLSLSKFANEISSFSIIGGVGNVFSTSGQELAKSTLDDAISEEKGNGQTASSQGKPQSSDVRFVPVGIAVSVKITNGGEIFGLFKATESAKNEYSATIDDSSVEENAKKINPELYSATSSSERLTLSDISAKQFQKTISKGEMAQMGVEGAASVYWGASAAASGAAAVAAGSTGGLILPVIFYGMALMSAWDLGQRLAATHWWESEKVDDGYTYFAKLEDTPYIRENISGFKLIQAGGAILGEDKKIIKSNYNDEIESDLFKVGDTASKLSKGNLPIEGVFMPNSLIIRVIFDNGFEVPVNITEEFKLDMDKRTVTAKDGSPILLTEARLLERVKQRQERQQAKAIAEGQQPPEDASSSQMTSNTEYETTDTSSTDMTSMGKPGSTRSPNPIQSGSLQQRIIAAKKMMIELSNKVGTATKMTEQESDVGAWDKKADDLMVEIITRTYDKILTPEKSEEVKPLMEGMSGWKWKSVGPMMGFGGKLSGVMDYFARVKNL